MKTQILSKARQQGNVLLASLIISAIMGVTLASYLIMTQSQHRSVVRSQVWNTSMVLTEAGVEDGLAMINKYNGNFGNLHLWTNNVSSENWSALGNNTYHARRYVSVDGWGTNYYDVYITNVNNRPVVTASGVASWNPAIAATPMAFFASAGDTTPSTGGRLAKRTVSVMTRPDPLFAVAMAAISTIDMNGNGITTDSFDSFDPNHSVNGLYPYGQISMVKSNGDVCTLATIIDSISVGNANINGMAKTGPNGTVEVGPSGYVSGGVDDDFNVKFPDVTLPSGTWIPVSTIPITIDGISYPNKIVSNGDYLLTGLSSSLYIASNVTCRIRISGNVNLTGNDEIKIDNGASVKLYMQGSSFKVSGNGFVNDNGNAASLYYFGLPSNSAIVFGGNGGFVGAIYAPQAAFSLGGGGNDKKDFIGASVTKSVKMNGHFNFHYDEYLRTIGPGRGYIPIAWAEKASQ
jgi:hypothetical protein